MKLFILLCGLLTSTSLGQAVQKIDCIGTPSVTPAAPKLFNALSSKVLGELSLTVPAVFPKPSTTDDIFEPYITTCGGVNISSDLTNLTLAGNFTDAMNILNSPFRGTKGSYVSDRNTIVLVFSGRYEYPSIKQDWSQDRVFLLFDGKNFSINQEGDYSSIYLKRDIIGARIDSGKLQPVLFDGKYYPLDLSKAKLIEFYASGDNAAFNYLKIDSEKQIIQIQNGIDFPSK